MHKTMGRPEIFDVSFLVELGQGVDICQVSGTTGLALQFKQYLKSHDSGRQI